MKTITINIWSTGAAVIGTVIAVAGGIALATPEPELALPDWTFQVAIDDPLTDAEEAQIAEAVAAADNDDDRIAIARSAADRALEQGRRLLVILPLDDHGKWEWELTWEHGTTADGALYETVEAATAGADVEAYSREATRWVTDVVVVTAAD